MEKIMELDLITWLKWKLGGILYGMNKRNLARFDHLLLLSFNKELSEKDQVKLENKAFRIRTRKGCDPLIFITATGYAEGMIIACKIIEEEKNAWFEYFYSTKLYSLIIKDWLDRPFLHRVKF